MLGFLSKNKLIVDDMVDRKTEPTLSGVQAKKNSYKSKCRQSAYKQNPGISLKALSEHYAVDYIWIHAVYLAEYTALRQLFVTWSLLLLHQRPWPLLQADKRELSPHYTVRRLPAVIGSANFTGGTEEKMLQADEIKKALSSSEQTHLKEYDVFLLCLCCQNCPSKSSVNWIKGWKNCKLRFNIHSCEDWLIKFTICGMCLFVYLAGPWLWFLVLSLFLIIKP